MSKKKPTSGMEDIPNIYSRPLLRDRFFWITIGTAGIWAVLIWLFLR